MDKDRGTSNYLAPFASLLFSVAALLHTLHVVDPEFSDPISRFYDRLSPYGQRIWNGTLAVLFVAAIMYMLITWAGLLLRYLKRRGRE